MMTIQRLVAPAVDWAGGSWAARMDQAASLLYCHGYITQSQREKITRTIEKQFADGLAAGTIVTAQRIEAGTDETAQQVRPEGREPDPVGDAPKSSLHTPPTSSSKGEGKL